MDKSKSNRNRWLKGKGYYIALVLCVGAVGLSGYIYYRSTQPTDVNNDAVNAGAEVTNPQAAIKDNTIPVLGTDPLILTTEEPTDVGVSDGSDDEVSLWWLWLLLLLILLSKVIAYIIWKKHEKDQKRAEENENTDGSDDEV